ncbi:hypothetical protein [Parashewanella tropica]|uniref:hypothetical protein n=1 Tax=Parashewanella tropica TaxID=2547970 RepID=UPI00105A5445|nr:hypothetical protein [Parashewanella tropica]
MKTLLLLTALTVPAVAEIPTVQIGDWYIQGNIDGSKIAYTNSIAPNIGGKFSYQCNSRGQDCKAIYQGVNDTPPDCNPLDGCIYKDLVFVGTKFNISIPFETGYFLDSKDKANQKDNVPSLNLIAALLEQSADDKIQIGGNYFSMKGAAYAIMTTRVGNENNFVKTQGVVQNK